jgi:vacuolar-type H+-ATPase subunit I/STV1
LPGDFDSDEDVDEDGLSSAALEGTSKIGKKKAEKMQAKAEKKLEREAMQKELEEKKKQREKEDEEARYCSVFYVRLLDLTNVCRLLTKQHKPVGFQIQYIHTCYTIFRWSLSAYMVGLRVLVFQPLGSSFNRQSM